MYKTHLNNPWKGLNYYTEGEVIYGRNAEIQSLSQYIFNNTQTVLYGRSGIGKSSILNAGIFPKARLEGMIPVSIRLKHDDEDNYILQIRAAIKDSGLKMKSILSAVDSHESETLWEFMHRHKFYNENDEPCAPLLVFDQFEEIFTLQKNEGVKKDFFRQLGNLLNEVKPDYIIEYEKKNRQMQSEYQETKVVSSGAFKGLNLKLNIRKADSDELNATRYLEHPDYHIVFAMREDFLSSLELYASSIPVMRDNRFGLLPINEEQAADIIRLPRKGLVDDDVTKLIIQQVTNRKDFELDGKPEMEVDSAVLSLFLSRLYVKKPETELKITTELVNTYSGHIIHDFYVDSITSNEKEHELLSKETILLLENQLLTREGRRNNVSRSDLIAQGVTAQELDILINKRKLLRQFNHGNDIRIEYIHDILCPVVKERKEQRNLILQQELERKRQEEEKQRLQAEAERKQREIEEKAAKEKAELEASALRIKRRNRRIYTLSFSVIFSILLGVTYYYFANIYTYKSYYKDLVRKNGWPVGVGEKLSEKERETSPIYYCLSHQGCKSPFLRLFGIGADEDLVTDIEVMSSNDSLPHKPRVSSFEVADIETTDAKALAYNELLSSISKIHLVGGENDMIEKEVAYNDKDSILFVIAYFHVNNSDMWGTYLTPTGKPMQIRDREGIDRMKISTDSLGRMRSLMYFDQNGVCQPVKDDVCGYSWAYDEEDNSVRRYLLNHFCLPIDREYNMVIHRNSNDTISTLYRKVSSVDDKTGVAASGPEGFCKLVEYGDKVYMYVSESDQRISIKTTTKDKKGNILSERIENNMSKKCPSIVNYGYNNNGEMLRMEKLTADGKPFAANTNDNYLYEWGYENGKMMKEIRKNKQGITFKHTIESKGNVTTEIYENASTNEYIVKVDSIFKNGYSTSYYGRNRTPINHKVKLEEDSISFHRKRCIKQDETETRYFYVFDGTEKKAPYVPDEFGKPLSYYCKEIKRDKDNNIISYKKLDEKGKIIKSMMFFTQNGQIIGRAAQGIDGTAVRCDKWEEEGFLYYKIYYHKDFDDNFVGIQGINEWGQKSVFNDPCEGYQRVEYKDFKNRRIENGPKIARSFKQYVLEKDILISEYSYPYIHILDKRSSLYEANFKDGDRIVKFGKWSIGNSSALLKSEWNAWDGTGKYVMIEVLRPIVNGTVERIRKDVKCTNTSKSLQEYHILSLKPSEYDYLIRNNLLK